MKLTTRRPFLTAEWRHLVMLNYEVDPAVLWEHVPRGTELDRWQGRVHVSMVGFRFLNTKILGVPVPFHRNFEEVNLRFYVRRQAPEGWRRGVTFVKELVPRAAVTLAARTVYHENYSTVPMSHSFEYASERPGEISRAIYSWTMAGREQRLELSTASAPTALAPASEEEFIAEHYWGYSSRRDGSTIEYRVEHPPWRAARATDARLDCDVAALYGEPFAEFLERPPTSAFLADGSEVRVNRGVRLQPDGKSKP